MHVLGKIIQFLLYVTFASGETICHLLTEIFKALKTLVQPH
jgi:hypothetical protein